MKTEEELNALKDEAEIANRKLAEPTDVSGGGWKPPDCLKFCRFCKTSTMHRNIGSGRVTDKNGRPQNAEVWLCQNCNRTNYFDPYTGEPV